MYFLKLNGTHELQVAKLMHCYINNKLPVPNEKQPKEVTMPLSE